MKPIIFTIISLLILSANVRAEEIIEGEEEVVQEIPFIDDITVIPVEGLAVETESFTYQKVCLDGWLYVKETSSDEKITDAPLIQLSNDGMAIHCNKGTMD